MTGLSKPRKAHGVSRSESEPIRPRNTKMRAASLTEKVKPAQVTKTQASAVTWLSGVIGDSAHRERDEGT